MYYRLTSIREYEPHAKCRFCGRALSKLQFADIALGGFYDVSRTVEKVTRLIVTDYKM